MIAYVRELNVSSKTDRSQLST